MTEDPGPLSPHFSGDMGTPAGQAGPPGRCAPRHRKSPDHPKGPYPRTPALHSFRKIYCKLYYPKENPTP